MSQWVDQELHNHPNRFSLNSLEKWDRLMCFLEERLEKGGKFIGNWKHKLRVDKSVFPHCRLD